MAALLPLLILLLVLGAFRKDIHKRKGDLSFVVIVLVVALLAWSLQT